MQKKVNKQKFPTNISRLPNKDKFDLHFWADYIELRCLLNKDSFYSIDDFLDDFKERNADLNEGDIYSHEEDDDVYEYVPKIDQNRAFAEDCFRIISSRISIFKNYYPFDEILIKKAIKLKKSINLKHKQYLFLLFSSALRYVKEYESALTKSFEIFSLKVMQNLMPKNAEIHLFGSSNNLIKNKKFSGNVWDKICTLSNTLNEGPPKARKEDFPSTSSGDSGLDFIGWVDNGDNQPHLITFTGQAACTDKWTIKESSSSYAQWKNKIAFSVTPINLVFIPFSLRRATGEWHRGADIGDCVLFDRQRLLFHYNNENNHFKKLPSYSIINNILKIKLSIYN